MEWSQFGQLSTQTLLGQVEENVAICVKFNALLMLQ